MWQEYFKLEDNDHDKYVYHLAQIAAEIRRSNVKNPNLVKTEHFIAKFIYDEAKSKEVLQTTDEVIAARTQNSKNFWMLVAGGLGEEGNKKRPLPAKVRAATMAANKDKA